MEDELNIGGIFALIGVGCFAVMLVVIIFLGVGFTSRTYDVWAQGKEGEAELAKAESNRKIKTLEAKAAEESAHHLSNAEVIRAEGVDKANEIIGQSLKENEAYLRYLWIQNLSHPKDQVIYVPTEANLPILEASRLNR